MISFVWSSKYPFMAGTGGSENYTAGQIRELQRRGIACRILTLGHGTHDGREEFPDITFKNLASKDELSTLDDTLVFITYPLDVATKRPSYVILHCPPPKFMENDHQFDPRGMQGKRIIAPSKFALKVWSGYYKKTITKTAIAYPFADEVFAHVRRPDRAAGAPIRLLFAGRLTPDKGIYTLMAALHMNALQGLDYEITVTTAGAHTEDGEIVSALVAAHPKMRLVPARKSPAEMAELMAEHDIVVVPSTGLFWQETFGMVSVEAQHAGCRVVASRSGGLPETDCGSMTLVEADNPRALANGIRQAMELGPVSFTQRLFASQHFTVTQSVQSLLKAINQDVDSAPTIEFLRKHLAPARPQKPVLPLQRNS